MPGAVAERDVQGDVIGGLEQLLERDLLHLAGQIAELVVGDLAAYEMQQIVRESGGQFQPLAPNEMLSEDVSGTRLGLLHPGCCRSAGRARWRRRRRSC
jgi:hypothetical protein